MTALTPRAYASSVARSGGVAPAHSRSAAWRSPIRLRIDVDRRRSDDLGQTSGGHATRQLHLPEALLRMRHTLCEHRRLPRCREHVRHARRVANDLGRLVEAGHCHRAGALRQPRSDHPPPHERRERRDNDGGDEHDHEGTATENARVLSPMMTASCAA